MTHGQATGWTEERVGELRRLWELGLSCSQIAAELGYVTRNSVIGKAHRLGLSGRVVGKKPGGETRRANGIGAAVQKIRAAKAKPPAPISTAPKVKPEPFVPVVCTEVAPLNISMMDLTEETCRWPEGEADFTFCGHRATHGPYCGNHAKIAFVPRKPRAAQRPTALGQARGGIFGRTA